MKTNKVLMAGAALAGLFGLTAVANADYVTYDFTGGSITISATVNGTTSILSGGVFGSSGHLIMKFTKKDPLEVGVPEGNRTPDPRFRKPFLVHFHSSPPGSNSQTSHYFH